MEKRTTKGIYKHTSLWMNYILHELADEQFHERVIDWMNNEKNGWTYGQINNHVYVLISWFSYFIAKQEKGGSKYLHCKYSIWAEGETVSF